MDLGLQDKVALVTGASRGIGRAIAQRLAAEGAKLALVARSAASLEAVAASLPVGAFCHAADLGTLEGVEGAVAAAAAQLGRIDILVNNAGAIPAGDFLTMPDRLWSESYALKLHGYIRAARAVFPLMQKQGGGRIVNVIGATARNPLPTYMAGGVANAGLVNFTKGLADLGAPHGILVTAVSPAATATERIEEQFAQIAAATGQSVEAVRAERMNRQPLGRMATPEDIADAVVFLASARAGFISGICLTVDGNSTRGVWL
ncbi:SDR family oxidoreductase [Roseomonas sp. AR75]|uniref:SDR family oxidoreductase n=1 Tax=Roseomonas sp. AR75 TaxID=2562311 RepID=UPI0010C0BD46|nr:SDR family oxidoreductase [Roseomonas sp. AR75]